MPSEFADQSYWDARFRKEESGFEWLADCDTTTADVEEALRSCSEPQPTLLHIGCGSSKLSLRLRDLVQEPHQVLNTDYAPSAVKIGRAWEQKQFNEKQNDPHGGCMRWTTGDLLSTDFVFQLRQTDGSFDIIVDKSTSDAIVCGEDVQLSSGSQSHLLRELSLPVDALHPNAWFPPDLLLAFHLALLTKPGGLWVCLSYSSSRFDLHNATEDDESDPVNALLRNLPNLWTEEQKELTNPTQADLVSVARNSACPQMRLLSRNVPGAEPEFILTEFFDDLPEYAILSHRWEQEEPTFADLESGTGRQKAGYRKLLFCAEWAARDRIKYFWIDTVCIDKKNSVELTEALNSMFRWYKNARICYVYLNDVPSDLVAQHFERSVWFKRGWTLQELLAPRRLDFFDRNGLFIGDKENWEALIQRATNLPLPILRGTPLSYYSIDERLSWMEGRTTTRVEDRAYCLMGILDVSMPVIYGERDKAMVRLREEFRRYQELAMAAVPGSPAADWADFRWTTRGRHEARRTQLNNDYGLSSPVSMVKRKYEPTDDGWHRRGRPSVPGQPKRPRSISLASSTSTASTTKAIYGGQIRRTDQRRGSDAELIRQPASQIRNRDFEKGLDMAGTRFYRRRGSSISTTRATYGGPSRYKKD